MPPSKSISKRQSNSLYRLMKFIHDACTEAGIQYWIFGGTLLGAVRHQGLIPWDDDGDIAIMQKDKKRFESLRKKFEDNGYDFDNSPDDDDEPCISKGTCSYIITGRKKGDLGCDVFFMKSSKDMITYADPFWEDSDNGGGRCAFVKNHVFPLVPIRFGNFFLFAPNNPIFHLNSCYGDDWNSSSQMLYNHRSGKWGSGKKHKMKPFEFSTPKPPKDTCDPIPPQISCEIIKKIRIGRKKSRRKSRKGF